tara:strand:+ start:10807 stop:11217 length:411 start_codon:yes stop_codon:yes gene_type:complete
MSNKQNPESLGDLSRNEMAELVKYNEELEKEEQLYIKEKLDERKQSEFSHNKNIKTILMRSPLEIINRSLFFLFIGSFLFSFTSVYSFNKLWFLLYVISAFSCILYTPNRKALKELIAAWPNLEDLIKGRSLWQRK